MLKSDAHADFVQYKIFIYAGEQKNSVHSQTFLSCLFLARLR